MRVQPTMNSTPAASIVDLRPWGGVQACRSGRWERRATPTAELVVSSHTLLSSCGCRVGACAQQCHGMALWVHWVAQAGRGAHNTTCAAGHGRAPTSHRCPPSWWRKTSCRGPHARLLAQAAWPRSGVTFVGAGSTAWLHDVLAAGKGASAPCAVEPSSRASASPGLPRSWVARLGVRG